MILKNRIYRSISTILIIFISMAGCIQFHHHDCDGDACLALSVTELDLSEWKSTIGCHARHFRCHESDRKHHTHSCDEDCGLHLSGTTDAGTSINKRHGLASIHIIFKIFWADIIGFICHRPTIQNLTLTDDLSPSLPQAIIFLTVDTRGAPV